MSILQFTFPAELGRQMIRILSDGVRCDIHSDLLGATCSGPFQNSQYIEYDDDGLLNGASSRSFTIHAVWDGTDVSASATVTILAPEDPGSGTDPTSELTGGSGGGGSGGGGSTGGGSTGGGGTRTTATGATAKAPRSASPSPSAATPGPASASPDSVGALPTGDAGGMLPTAVAPVCDGGLGAWWWLLIGLALAAVCVVVVALVRRRPSTTDTSTAGTPGPDPTSA